MQVLVAASHVIPVPQLPTVCATQDIPSQTIGEVQVVVEATQVVPFQVMPAPQVVVEPMQVLVAASHVVPAPQLPTVCATHVVPFHVIGATQLPAPPDAQ